MKTFNEHRSTTGKARSINLNEEIYGTFAEIGAGQEVARHFFQAGLASQTIAKTISAYDMSFSDEIYGKESTGRYVCESRLNKMLDKEYNLLGKRLGTQRGDRSLFFAYANTVTTSSTTGKSCHGWMGVRFQIEPKGPANDIVMHVRMLDKHRLQQQEILGVLGVNLVYAAFFERKNPKKFLDTLVEDIKEGRLAVDLIRFSGPAFEEFDNHIINIELLSRKLSEFAYFVPESNSTSLTYVGDSLFNKSLFIQRGHFSPLNPLHIETLKKGTEQFKNEYKLKNENCLPVFEMTLKDFNKSDSEIVDKIIKLNSQGFQVMVTNFSLFFELKQGLKKYTHSPIAFSISASLVDKIFNPKYYSELSGGLLEGLGRLLDSNTNIYVYPHKNEDKVKLMHLTLKDIKLNEPENKILDYFISLNWIKDFKF